jgi:hypothetical protein
MVRKEGFEPPRPFGHKILSLARLPVPPLPQVDSTFIIYPVVRHGDQVEANTDSRYSRKIRSFLQPTELAKICGEAGAVDRLIDTGLLT